MKGGKFTAEDFFGILGEDHRVHPTRAAERANAKLDTLKAEWLAELLKDAPLYSYCEDCKEWVAPPKMVCNYRGKTAKFIPVSNGWDEIDGTNIKS